jgi:6-phosphogluconolactonase
MNGATRSDIALRCHVFRDAQALLQSVLMSVSNLAAEAIAHRGSFHLVLAGGNTPLPLYRRLPELRTDWERWHLYFGDERCLPEGHPDRNSTLVDDAWLARSGIPRSQVRVIPADMGAEQAAARYAKTVAAADFDLALLGLGEDGHTASLFPGKDWGEAQDAPLVLAVHDAPKPPPDRVSLSARRLSAAHHVFFLATGEAKRQALMSLLRGERIPASAIRPASGVDVYTDLQV